MLNPIRRYRSSEYCGGCEFPSCSNKILSQSTTRKFCITHQSERGRNPAKFRKDLEEARKKLEDE